MTENTPGTSTDNALGSEGDSDQLDREDTLIDRGVEDLLDEGYSPPDRDPIQQMGGLDPDDPTTQQLNAEEPEVWDSPAGQAPGERQADRAGRLEETTDGGRGTDAYAVDAGISGGAASAEEAAVRIDDDDDDDEEDSVDIFSEPDYDDEGNAES